MPGVQKPKSAAQPTPAKPAKSLKRKKPQKGSREPQEPAKVAKKVPDLVVKAKELWTQANSTTLPKAERTEAVNRLMDHLKGHIHEVCFRKDGSRILQTCLKYGSTEQRDLVVAELKGSFIAMTRQPYTRHLFSKMLMYCTSQRPTMIGELHGNIRKLIGHKEASQVVEEVFVVYSNVKQRTMLVQEFYGPEFALFKDNPQTLEDILTNSPDKREAVFRNLLENITDAINKSTINHNIMHQPVLEYATLANDAEVQRLIDAIKEDVVHILHSKEGYKAAMLLFLRANAKDRKIILKTFKSFVKKICMEEYGHLVMIQIFDALDDTVFLGKIISAVSDLSALCECLAKLLEHDPNDKDHIMQHIVANRVLSTLVKADHDASKRHVQRKDAMQYGPLILKHIETHLPTFAANFGSFVVLALLEHPECGKQVKKQLNAHKKAIAQAASNGNKGSALIVEKLA
ncbi:Pumilio y domain member 6 [Dimargaris verticillata]|uniref:Pumilio y domain member 6 n=1 Tax=Dimargaris verticillata TaxID=2761393 RepID=A0A9W8B555_9FUNG|nr:Pumilio y domain member 6 [Dimargaris verticillata]